MAEPETIFYDGTCGLCDRWVRFVRKHDPRGDMFATEPLQGEVFAAVVPDAERDKLPDSVIVRTRDGRLLSRSTAVRHILRRLGGPWRFAAGLLGLLPRPLRDWGYDRVASVRHRLFPRSRHACSLPSRDGE